VVERTRRPEEQDRFIWICEQCSNTLHETTVRFNDPSDAVGKATAAMKSDPKLATCNSCGTVLAL
jgi:3-hydroxyanthranilate 3,4-dioxygenase